MILVINAGSSSIKFQLYKIEEKNNFKVICKGLAESIGVDGKLSFIYEDEKYEIVKDLPNHDVAAKLILESLKSKKIIKDFYDIVGVGHRIVHGGETFNTSTIVNDKVITAIKDNVKLAPLHNPAGLSALSAFQSVTNCKHIAVFDTTFHTTMPKINYLYPVPYEWYEKYQIRRYGFHGISYQYITLKLSEILNKPLNQINAIICHLGNGSSVCAVKEGKSFNTSMGLTPLAGLMMGTRSGDIDPSIHEYIAEQLNINVKEVVNILNKKSGLLGISQISSDMRKISSESNNSQAKLALDLYAKRVIDFIVQYQNDLDNKVDALVFTAGIGENSAFIRQLILDNLKTMDISFCLEKNNNSYDTYLLISNSNSKVKVLVIRTDEELMICKETSKLLEK